MKEMMLSCSSSVLFTRARGRGWGGGGGGEGGVDFFISV